MFTQLWQYSTTNSGWHPALEPSLARPHRTLFLPNNTLEGWLCFIWAPLSSPMATPKHTQSLTHFANWFYQLFVAKSCGELSLPCLELPKISLECLSRETEVALAASIYFFFRYTWSYKRVPLNWSLRGFELLIMLQM